MNLTSFLIGGFVFAIVIFRRELLVRKETFVPILFASLALFCAGIALHFMQSARDSYSGALLCPLLSLGLYRFCRGLFVKWTNREPVDTFMNFDAGLGPDKLFTIVYFTLAAFTWGFTAIAMFKLAQAGW